VTAQQRELMKGVVESLVGRNPRSASNDVRNALRQTERALPWWIQRMPRLQPAQLQALAELKYEDSLAIIEETPELDEAFRRARRLRREAYPNLRPGRNQSWNVVLRRLDPELDRLLRDGSRRKMDYFEKVRAVLSPKQIEVLDAIGACVVRREP
jgi:hypothetical protein